MFGDTRGIERRTIIEVARRAGGLTQAELARRAGTTQSAISEYERCRKSPTLDVTERLVRATGADLAMTTLVEFTEHPTGREKVCWVPNRLWRVEVPQCFARVKVGSRVWDLGSRSERRGFYEQALTGGVWAATFRWVDAALLVDLWPELDLPKGVREAWEPLVVAASTGAVEGYWDSVHAALDASRAAYGESEPDAAAR